MAIKKFALNCANVQSVYAVVLRRFTMISIAFLAVSFLIYFFQWIPSYVSPEKINELIRLKLGDYREAASIPHGWDWLGLISYSDYISFSAIAFLSAVSIFVYFLLTCVFLKCRDYIFAVIAILQILVFILAASGLVRAGH